MNTNKETDRYKRLIQALTMYLENIASPDEELSSRVYDHYLKTLNEWILGTSQPVVNAAILERITQSLTDPTHYTNHKSLIIKWYVDKELLDSEEYKNTPFIIGMDTSNNVGRDFTTIVILEPKTMAVVGTCRCNVS